jgi:hypothetical protein
MLGLRYGQTLSKFIPSFRRRALCLLCPAVCKLPRDIANIFKMLQELVSLRYVLSSQSLITKSGIGNWLGV